MSIIPEGTTCGIHGEPLTQRDDGTFRCTGCDAAPRRAELGNIVNWTCTPDLAGPGEHFVRLSIAPTGESMAAANAPAFTTKLLTTVAEEHRLEVSQSLARLAAALHPAGRLDDGEA